MALLTGSTALDLLVILGPILYFVYWFFHNNDDYWHQRGVPHVRKGLLMHLIFGKVSQYEALQEIYQSFKGQRYCGYFTVKNPVLMIRDPELINRILVKDFKSFQDREFGKGNSNDPTTTSLFSIGGQNWRSLRYKLTPTFSVAKLKCMFEQLCECGDNMVERIENLANKNEDVDIKDFLAEFTLDVIASIAFGLEFKPDSPQFNEFRSTVNKIHQTQSQLSLMKLAFIELFPKLVGITGVRPLSKDIGDYFVNLTKSTLKYRKENYIQRKDYFQLLMTLKEQEESGKTMLLDDPGEEDPVVKQIKWSEKDSPQYKTKLFTEETICANTFIFLSAGTESVSSIVSFIMYELCRHSEVQRRLQKEVDSVLRNQGRWTYDTIKDMVYLDQVVQEAQRLYPILSNLQRVCVKPYQVPDSDLVIEKGVIISIPHYSLQRDPNYYPDPESFNPDRFEGNNFKPNPTFMPFGDGPRMCIAMRFAVMEVKTCVARIMANYSVKLSSKTRIPIRMKFHTFTPAVEGGIWITFQKRINDS